MDIEKIIIILAMIFLFVSIVISIFYATIFTQALYKLVV